MPRLKSPLKPVKRAKVQDRLSNRALLIRRVRRSLRPIAAIAAGLLAIVLIPTLWSGAHRLVTGPLDHGAGALAARLGFRVKTIEIRGATTTPISLVREALGVDRGMPIFGFSVAEAAGRVGRLGPVRDAVVQRILPATVLVTITERQPFAIWQEPSGRFVLIDRKGGIMVNHDAAAAKARDPSLLLLAGFDAPAHAAGLIDNLHQVPAIEDRVVAAQRIDDLRWNLIMKNHSIIKLPARHVAAALAELMSIQNRVALLDRPVKFIDLRLADRLVVRPYPTGYVAESATDPAAAPPIPGEKTLETGINPKSGNPT